MAAGATKVMTTAITTRGMTTMAKAMATQVMITADITTKGGAQVITRAMALAMEVSIPCHFKAYLSI